MGKVVLLGLWFCLTSAGVSAAEFAVIAHPSNPRDTLSSMDAKNIFLGKKKTWADGSKIIVFTNSDKEVTRSFTKKVVGKTPRQYTVYWKKRVFTGKGAPPAELKGSDEVKTFIAADRRGISYIAADALDDSVKALELQ